MLVAGYAYLERGWRQAAEAEAASLRRSVAVLEDARDQAREAAAVANAAAERERGRAQEYDDLREALIRGDEDAELPDWFRDYLDNLLGGVLDQASPGIRAGSAGSAERTADPGRGEAPPN